jgi:L,D-transpeptidase catalytic domain
MKHFLSSLRRQWPEALLAAALAALSLQIYFVRAAANFYQPEMTIKAEDGHANMSLRNSSFPDTFISEIHIDLTSPLHGVTLAWEGRYASEQPAGPFPSSPGEGTGENDCNDAEESCRNRSNCTPKGEWVVQSFSDHMSSAKVFKFVTWFNTNREIGLHSYPEITNYPDSHGCVRLSEHDAQLIHNNSIAGRTKVVVAGTWTTPRH